MRTLGKSVEARYYELLDKPFEFPEDGYQGDYIIEIAKSIWIGSAFSFLISVLKSY